MSYVPELREEEAKILMLRALTDEPKGQAAASAIKEIIATQKQRPWSEKDIQRVAIRSNAPSWHQIVQNACDRANEDGHYYLAAFTRTVAPSPHKILQITDEGRIFVEELHSFEHRLRGDGFGLVEYLDVSPVDGLAWKGLKNDLKKRKLIYKAYDLLRSLRSQEYAVRHYPDAEKADFHQKILFALRQRCDPVQAKSIDAWIVGRNYIGKLANLRSDLDVNLESIFI